MPLRRHVNQPRRLPNEITWEYTPSAHQLVFHQSRSRFKLFGGAMGGGKSVALCAEIIKLAIWYPGNRLYLCRHEMAELRRTTLVTFERVCPVGLVKRHYGYDNMFVLRNESQIIYGGLGGQEDRDKIKSLELGAFAIDEATETTEDMWKLLCSRLRWKLPDGKYPEFYGLLASNPEPGWVKDRFVTGKRKNHAFIRALPTDNPFLPDDYVSTLRTDWEHVDQDWIRRYLEGSWDVFEGQIYKEFSREKHIFKDIEISDWWTCFRTIDYGYTNPTCCLWIAMDPDDRMLVYDEHYEREMTIEQNAAIIEAKHPAFRGVTLMDPSMFSISSTKRGKPWSHADEYMAHGIIGIKPYGDDGHISEAMGIQLVKQRLKANRLLIDESCINTITEIVKYRWRDLNPNRALNTNLPEIPVDKDNHAMDALRYATMWRPMASKQDPAELDPRSVRYAINKLKGLRNRPQYAGWS